MGKTSISNSLLSILIVSLVIIGISANSQEKAVKQRYKSLFIEAGGSGVSVLTANFDIRFYKGRSDGLGMRIGIGGESSKTEPILGEGEIKNKFFTVPLEVNYILGKNRFSFEIGYSLTYISQTKTSSIRILEPNYTSTDESGNFMVSYIPVGFRLKPKGNGFMLKFNVGPLWIYSAPNLFDYEKTQFWAGLAIGYSFY